MSAWNRFGWYQYENSQIACAAHIEPRFESLRLNQIQCIWTYITNNRSFWLSLRLGASAEYKLVKLNTEQNGNHLISHLGLLHKCHCHQKCRIIIIGMSTRFPKPINLENTRSVYQKEKCNTVFIASWWVVATTELRIHKILMKKSIFNISQVWWILFHKCSILYNPTINKRHLHWMYWKYDGQLVRS